MGGAQNKKSAQMSERSERMNIKSDSSNRSNLAPIKILFIIQKRGIGKRSAADTISCEQSEAGLLPRVKSLFIISNRREWANEVSE